MTVSSRKLKDGLRWRYDFERAGQRYGSESIYTSKAKAEKAEREHKAALKRGVAPAQPGSSRAAKPGAGVVTLADACALYWADVARHHRSARDIHNRLEIVKRLIGANVDVRAIRFATVNAAMQARRAETGRFGKPLSPTTVNRDVIDSSLRPALNHAARVHELALPKIDWGKLRLKERDELVCEFTPSQIERWSGELGSDTERLFLAVALTYGPRMGELFFPPEAVRPDAPGGPELELGRYVGRGGIERESRKDGSLHTLPLMADDAAALADLAERAAAAGHRTIWLDSAGAPISYYAMAGRIRRAAARAGIDQDRLLHGMRHHAATAITRANQGALVSAQRLLGHKRITTTQRYAHVSKDDLAGMIGRVGAAKTEAKIHAPATPKPRPMTR